MSSENTADSKPYVILAALAFDKTGENALREAARVAASRTRAELHLVHVLREDSQPTTREIVSLEKRIESAPHEIQQYVERVYAQAPRKIVAHVRTGTPANAILQAAVDVNADILVVGTHHRPMLTKLILGSVAEQVVREALCPVLVALEQDYAHIGMFEGLKPACEECKRVRRETSNASFWCEQHARSKAQPLVFDPSARPAEKVSATPAAPEPVQSREAEPKASEPSSAATTERRNLPDRRGTTDRRKADRRTQPDRRAQPVAAVAEAAKAAAAPDTTEPREAEAATQTASIG